METIKKISCVVFVVGIILIFGAVGTDDFYVIEMHQAHALNWWQIFVGCVCLLPLPIINETWG